MTDLKIYDFWYKCCYCDKEVSVSQSNPLQENEVLFCFKCGATQRVTYMDHEPKVKTVKVGK